MNIYDTLFTAKQGMTAHQVALNTTSQNVANVSTEGYSRKSAVFASVPGSTAIGAGGGVQVTGINRHADDLTNKRLMKEMGMYGSADQQATLLSQVSEMFNDVGGAGLGSSIDNFFTSLTELESNPADVTARMEILVRGEELSGAFNRISSEINSLRYNIDAELEISAEAINSRTSEIAHLNKQIAIIVAQGGDASTQMDQREQMVKEISTHANISYIVGKNHQMTVFLEGGMPLVEGVNVSTLQINDTASAGNATVEYVSSNGLVSDITNFIKGGQLGGALEVRDNVLVNVQTELDQLAFDIVTAFNAQHSAGFGLDGVGGRDFFTTLATSTDAASLMELDAGMIGNPDAIAAAATAGGVPGDNQNILLLSEMAGLDLASAGTATFNETYAALSGEIGLTTRHAIDETTLRSNSVDAIQTLKESETGVSIDEEMVNLIQYQRSYEASARVLSVMNEVLSTLLSLR